MPPARTRIVLGAVLCLLVVGVVAVLYQVDLRQLDAVDHDLGAGPQGWTYRHVGVQHFLLFVEAVFATIPMTIYTVVAAGLLVWRDTRAQPCGPSA